MPSDDQLVVGGRLSDLPKEAQELLQALAAFTSIALGLVKVLCTDMKEVDPASELVKELGRAADMMVSKWAGQPAGYLLSYLYTDEKKFEELLQAEGLILTDGATLPALCGRLWDYMCQRPVKRGGAFAFDILREVNIRSIFDAQEILIETDAAPMKHDSSVGLILAAGAVTQLLAWTVKTAYSFNVALGNTFTAVDAGICPVKDWSFAYRGFVKDLHDLAGLKYTDLHQSMGVDRNAVTGARF